MKTARKIQSHDVIFLHADDRATRKYKYSPSELRESLLLHILYCGRVLIPANYILANTEFDHLFQIDRKLSENSDFYKLVQAGHVVPLLFRGDYGSILDYAEYSLDRERKILLTCPEEQWLGRAELLQEFPFAAPRTADFRQYYKETALSLLTRKSVQTHYFGRRYLTSGASLVGRIVDQLRSVDKLYRSDLYRIAGKSRSKKLRSAIENISDAAYYASFADIFSANPAVPDPSLPAIIYHYSGVDGPTLYAAGKEEVIGAGVPSLNHLSIARVIDDLRDSTFRKEWLKVYRKQSREGNIDLAADEVQIPLTRLTRLLVEYLSASGPLQREKLLSQERKFTISTRILRVGSDVMLAASSVMASADLIQERFPITGISFFAASTAAKLLLRRSSKRLQTLRPQFGSSIPVRRTFTLKGRRYW